MSGSALFFARRKKLIKAAVHPFLEQYTDLARRVPDFFGDHTLVVV